MARKRPTPIGVIPAHITEGEKKKVLAGIDKRLGDKAYKYGYKILHGGSVPEKERIRQEIKRLELERKSIENMQPTVPGHVRLAEKGPGSR